LFGSRPSAGKIVRQSGDAAVSRHPAVREPVHFTGSLRAIAADCAYAPVMLLSTAALPPGFYPLA
jgi:hypothetical protein